MTARTYGDGCGIAQALDLIGERWALLVVRELLLGPLRFSDLRAGLPGAGPTVLSQRLRELEAAGVLHRRELPPPAASTVYDLTTYGRELEPIVLALGTWALRSPLRTEGPISAVSAMLTLRTYFHADRPWSGSAGIRLGARHYRATVVAGELTVTAGDSTGGDATLTTDPDTFVALLGGASLTAAVEGDRSVVVRLLDGVTVPG